MAVALLLVTLLPATTTCTLIGAGIGSAVPSYESVRLQHGNETVGWQPGSGAAPPPQSYQIAVEPGEKVEVVRTSDHRYFQGVFKGIVGDELVLEDGLVISRAPSAATKVTDIERLRVQRGSYWAEGMVVGAVLDTIAIVFIVVAIRGGEALGQVGL